MTTEIAVLNKTAVALAADSAVTIGKSKVYNSVNKLFMLSKYKPVGIMVYGNAEFMGVPWETIIKAYRKNLGTKSFDRLAEYSNDFLGWISKNDVLFGEQSQAEHVKRVTRNVLTEVRDAILRAFESELAAKRTLVDEDFPRVTAEVVKRVVERVLQQKVLPTVPESHASQLVTKYRDLIVAIAKETFEKLPLEAAQIDALVGTIGELFAREIQTGDSSGVVIAGFGEHDFYPSIQAYSMEGIANSVLTHHQIKEKCCSIDQRMNSAIIPFAQTDEAVTFVVGASPAVLEVITGYIDELVSALPKTVVANVMAKIAESGQKVKLDVEKLNAEFDKQIAEEKGKFRSKLQTYQQLKQARPLLDVVSALPKDELGTFAESIVTLTSIKRRFSMGPESVGGPVDVAVISKGDGFVWIRRKLYFDGKLNPHFAANYYRDESHTE